MLATTHFSRSRALRRWALETKAPAPSRGLPPQSGVSTAALQRAAGEAVKRTDSGHTESSVWPLWNPALLDRLQPPLTRYRE